MDNIVIIGFGGHARSVADSIEKGKKYHIVGYTDAQDYNCKYPYLGTDDVLGDVFKDGIHNAVLGVGFLGNSSVRDSIVSKCEEIGFLDIRYIESFEFPKV